MTRAGLRHGVKRWLYLVHRWIGIAACLLFLMWFLSGLVMIYVPYPALTDAERLAGLPAIDWSRVRLGPDAAGRMASPSAPPRAAVLEMAGAEPVWRITPPDGREVTLLARTGAPLGRVDAAWAMRAAAAFARAPAASVEQLGRDQWTVAGRYDAHRPLYRVRLAGPGARDLYVSGATGAVVLDTTGRERFWNWLGAVTHWIYPTVLRQDQATWRQVVMWVSGPCILVAITGLWIGLLRVRFGRRRFRGGRVTPYRGWMLWHHVAGLAGGVTLTLWIVSGWLSVDPGHLFRSVGPTDRVLAAYAGAAPLPMIPVERLRAVAGPGARRISLFHAIGRPWIAVSGRDTRRVVDARDGRPDAPSTTVIVHAARRLMPGAPVVAVERLTAPDLYWYEVAGRPTLPVLRIRFGDAAGTWVHLDPATGRLLDTIDRRGRAYRWVYDLFHKWDLNALTLHRPAWDAMLWAFSLLGIIVSASGVVIGWRRLRPHQSRTRHSRRGEPLGSGTGASHAGTRPRTSRA